MLFVRDALREPIRSSLLLAGLALVIGLLVALLLANVLSRSLKQLAEGLEQVGRGGLGAQVAGIEASDLGQVASSFNVMSQRLAEDRSQMAVGKRWILDRLPVEVRRRVVWRERFWLTDEALSTYVRSAGRCGL